MSQTAAIRMPLSASTSGLAIKVTANTSPGTLVHTATANSTPGSGGIWDEIWLWIYSDIILFADVTIEFGDATAPDHNIRLPLIWRSGARLVVPGFLLQNSTTVKVFATGSFSGNIFVMGHANRITNA